MQRWRKPQLVHIPQQPELHLPHPQHQALASLHLHSLSPSGVCQSWAAVPGAGQQGRAQEHGWVGGTALRCVSHSPAAQPLWHHHVGASFPFSHPSKFTTDTWDIVFRDKKPGSPEWCSFGSGFFSQQHRRRSSHFLVKPSNSRGSLGQSEPLRPQTGDTQEK